jgi:hypothetical protein
MPPNIAPSCDNEFLPAGPDVADRRKSQIAEFVTVTVHKIIE